MTVCVTGDVHHMSMDTRDQSYLDCTEVEAAIQYVNIAQSYDLPVTLFLTGRAAENEPSLVNRLISTEGVEVGGHNYFAHSTLFHSIFRAFTGSWHGPEFVQRWEISRTVDALSNHGATVKSWRDHAYRHDANTMELLSKQGLTHFSDILGPGELVYTEGGLKVVPINTPPDHDHVYHAFRTPAYQKQCNFDGPFGPDAYPAGKWCDWILNIVTERVASDETATILAHPACQYLADSFETFERLCMELEAYKAVTLSEV